MNIPANIPLTMSSREIADLCEKEHKHVLRDIRSMLVTLYGDDHIEKVMPKQNRNRHSEYVRENADAILSAILNDGPNRDHLERAFKWERDSRGYVTVIHLDREHTYTLVSGYNVKLRKRIINRWMELETGTAQFQIPQTYADALRLAAEQTEKVERQALVIAELQEDAEALDQIANAHGSLTRTDAAKHLGVAPQLLCKWLNTHGWTYRRAGAKDDTAYQSKINAGYLEHKVKTGLKPDGTEWIGTQVRVTPKGLTVLAKAFPRAARAA